MGPCEFCEELCSNCKTITGFEESGKGRIIASYAYWRLIPTMGCFTKGYTLVVNAMHRESLYYCSGDEIIELCSFLRLIKRKYKEHIIQECLCLSMVRLTRIKCHLHQSIMFICTFSPKQMNIRELLTCSEQKVAPAIVLQIY